MRMNKEAVQQKLSSLTALRNRQAAVGRRRGVQASAQSIAKTATKQVARRVVWWVLGVVISFLISTFMFWAPVLLVILVVVGILDFLGLI